MTFMWMNSDTHNNIIFEIEDYVEFIYPAAENKKNRNPALVLFAFWIHTHTHTGPGSTLEKRPAK